MGKLSSLCPTAESVEEALNRANIAEIDISSIKEKLDRIDIVTPEMYGAVGDGETDDYQALQSMFDDVCAGTIIFGKNKVYATTQGIVVHGGYVSLNVILSCIKYIGDSNDSVAVLQIENNVKKFNGKGRASVMILGGGIECNRLAGCGIRNLNAYHTRISKVKITDFRSIGIDIGDDTITFGNTLSTQVIISDCYIANFGWEDRGTAIRLIHTDNNVSNCVTNGHDVGIEVRAGGNYISNCHFTNSSSETTSQSDLTHKFIYNNPLSSSMIQLNSFSNCYFNGSRIRYVIYNELSNSLITALDNCSIILGKVTIPVVSYLMNANYSAVQINNIKCRKSDIHTLYGLVRYVGSAGTMTRSTFSSDCAGNKTQLLGDINNMDTSASSFITSNTNLPAHTMRRIATVFEPSNLPSGASFDITLNGTTRMRVYTSNEKSEIEWLTGSLDSHVKIYKDKESRIEDIGEFELRCFDIYAYNDTDEDYGKLSIIYADNSNYPFSQICTYFGSEADVLNPTLDGYVQINDSMENKSHENILPYPYRSKVMGWGGVKVTESNGELTLNGTATDTGVCYRLLYVDNPLPLERKKYAFNAGIDKNAFISGCRIDVSVRKTDGEYQRFPSNYNDVIIDNTNGDFVSIDYISATIAEGAELVDYTLRPVLEYGTETHGFVNPALSNVNLLKNKAPAPIVPPDKREACFFGDSITAGTGTIKAYHMYWHDWSNLKCKNYGVGSIGFAKSISGEHLYGNGAEGIGTIVNFSESVTIINIMQSLDSFDRCVLFAGTNDFGSSIDISVFRIAVQNTLDYALTKTPYILVITPIQRAEYKTRINNVGKKLSDYTDVIKEECESRGIACANGFDVPFNPDNNNYKEEFIPDGLHPNSVGHNMLARRLYNDFLATMAI